MNDSKSDIILDKIVQDLLSTVPLIFRSVRSKLINRSMIQLDEDMSPPHFEVMKLLKERGTLHMAEIGDELQISRPQMTLLVDRLVRLGIAERQTNSEDRRFINVTLTDEGKIFIKDREKQVKEAIIEALSSLNRRELRDLSTSLRTLQEIFSKLE